MGDFTMVIKNKLLVMSGKGGVGKTTIAVNIAYFLNQLGYKVGLMDVDIHGPNAPKMLGLKNKKLLVDNVTNKIIPLKINPSFKVVSVGFFAETNKAIIWRGPLKHNLLKQFIEDVDWGELDYLIVDFPPGTGDEHISVVQLLKNVTGAIIVSTPQEVSIIDSLKSVDFAEKMKVPIIGFIENMSGGIFGEGSIEKVSLENKIDFLGKLSMNKKIVESSDSGEPFVLEEETSKEELKRIIDKIMFFCKNNVFENKKVEGNKKMNFDLKSNSGNKLNNNNNNNNSNSNNSNNNDKNKNNKLIVDEKVRFAFATDDGINYTKEHFGSAKKYLIYIFNQESKKLEFEKEILNTTPKEKIHGDPQKATKVSDLLKQISVLVAFVMGPNIVRMRKKFVPIISREINIVESLKILAIELEEVIEELKKEVGVDKKIIYLKKQEEIINKKTNKKILNSLKLLKHPEINLSLVELGMIGEIKDSSQEKETFLIKLKLPFLEIPIKQALINSIKENLKDYKIEVECVLMSEEEKKTFLELARKNWAM